jgi:GNAT superfamily N-acetyltransferase
MLPERGRCLTLRSGDHTYVRLFRPSDGAHLCAGFEKLSPRSRYTRFFSATPRLNPAQLKALTGVDTDRHVALCAGVIHGGVWEGAGIARFIRSGPGAREAEVALTIIDKYQGRGLGTLLFQLLVQEAWERGITQFTGQVLPDNRATVKILRRYPIECEVLPGPVLSFRMRLARAVIGAQDVSALHEDVLYGAPQGLAASNANGA